MPIVHTHLVQMEIMARTKLFISSVIKRSRSGRTIVATNTPHCGLTVCFQGTLGEHNEASVVKA
jgi:hypothetical protein